MMTNLKSPLRYPGGKSKVSARILPFLPPHTDYREPFAGGLGIFLAKEKVATNWINDLHPGVYAFWKTLRDEADSFINILEHEVDRYDPKGLWDVWAYERSLMSLSGEVGLFQRAVQFYILNRLVFGGRVVYDPKLKSRLFYSNPNGLDHFDRKANNLWECSKKLQGVKITNYDFACCFERAKEGSLLYCDPPYLRDSLDTPTSRLYAGTFTMDDHDRLCDVAHLAKSKGTKILLSYDDHYWVRDAYRTWLIKEVSWTYSGTRAVTKAGEKEVKVKGRELLVANYSWPKES